jgi:hypothetical protein
MRTSTTETKTNWLGQPVTDEADEPITVTTEEDSESEEKKVYETRTKTNWLGQPVLAQSK